MPTQTGLKLEIAPETVEALFGLTPFSATPQALLRRSTYFDTPAAALFAAGCTLRIREAGGRHIQTVRGAPGLSCVRPEWETDVAANRPALDGFASLFKEAGADPAQIGPLFEVRNHRLLWRLAEDGTMIAASLDRGLIVAGERQAPVCEIGLELEAGDPGVLFSLARRIAALVPVRVGVMSRAERGFRLMQAQPCAVRAQPPLLSAQTAVADSFRIVAAGCLRQYRLNEDILLRRRQAEAVHQARVALRRLRSAFTLYGDRLAGPESRRLKEELRWLAGALGDARDLDVLAARACHAGLKARLQGIRAARHDRLAELLGSARARALLLDLYAWLRCDADPAAQGDGETMAGFAAGVLERMRKRLRRHGAALAELDDAHRHEARKDAKKLRYAAEFFGPLFDDRRARRRRERFALAMETLQDRLGGLNDLAAGHALLETLGLGDHEGAGDLAAAGDRDALLRAAEEALDAVVDAKRFWRGR